MGKDGPRAFSVDHIGNVGLKRVLSLQIKQAVGRDSMTLLMVVLVQLDKPT